MTFIVVHPDMADELRGHGVPDDCLLIQGEIGQIDGRIRFVTSPLPLGYTPKPVPRRRVVSPSWRRSPVQSAVLLTIAALPCPPL